MISVMYTTSSYHGADQPLGEYMYTLHVSLAPYSGFQTARGKDTCLIGATCMYMGVFFLRNLRNCGFGTSFKSHTIT